MSRRLCAAAAIYLFTLAAAIRLVPEFDSPATATSAAVIAAFITAVGLFIGTMMTKHHYPSFRRTLLWAAFIATWLAVAVGLAGSQAGMTGRDPNSGSYGIALAMAAFLSVFVGVAASRRLKLVHDRTLNGVDHYKFAL